MHCLCPYTALYAHGSSHFNWLGNHILTNIHAAISSKTTVYTTRRLHKLHITYYTVIIVLYSTVLYVPFLVSDLKTLFFWTSSKGKLIFANIYCTCFPLWA